MNTEKFINLIMAMNPFAKSYRKVIPVLTNNTGKTIIETVSKSRLTPNNSYIIISKSGRIIVADPTSMPTKKELNLKPDVITITHKHNAHTDPKFTDRISCKKSVGIFEDFYVDNIHIYSIPSAHNGDDINKTKPDNLIYVYELDELRIAHMGDIGQEHLSDEQLEKLEYTDIVFMQFFNPFSRMFTIDKCLNILEQVKPQIIIPTHSNKRITEKIGRIVGKLEVKENIFTICPDDLNDALKVVHLENTLKY